MAWPSGGICKRVPIYGGDLWLYRDRKKYLQAYKHLGGKSELSDTSLGMSVSFANKKSGAMIYLVGIYDGRVSTLVHEMTHTALEIARTAGFKADDGNTEPFAYLLDNLVHTLLPIVVPSLRKQAR